MVGEIRDPETAQIAIQSALTGHLVFTTVHANNVIDVLGRFLNMGVEPYQFVSALNCVLAQRLVRMICTHCKRPVHAGARDCSTESAHRIRRSPTRTRSTRAPAASSAAGTGFKGRTAICELMDLTDRIRDMILDRRPTSEIKTRGARRGHDVPARVRRGPRARRRHDAARNQQGDFRRMSASPRSPRSAPGPTRGARRRGWRQLRRRSPLKLPASASPSPASPPPAAASACPPMPRSDSPPAP